MKILLLSLFIVFSWTCSNLLVTKGASETGDTLISYAADSHSLYGALYFFPEADHEVGSMIDIVDWDSQKPIGRIKQVNHTFNVVGYINSQQVSITETTFGGLADLQSQPNAQIDYGNLIWITLQRAKTARHAIQIMGELVEEYGYYSEGESFSIADRDEVWILEMIGKGEYELGAVWVAQRIPDGYVSAHANQARIRTFPLNDLNNAIYSKDVISFAKARGYVDPNLPEEEFSFSDTYDPVDFSGARICEARVYSFFKKVGEGIEQYLDYAQGYNLKNRMPLYIKPTKKLTLRDVQEGMRSRFEGTWFAMDKDVGSDPYGVPYRWRPMVWESSGKKYLHERAIATQQTAFSMICQMRKDKPTGIIHFGMDDTGTTVWTPFYNVITRIPDGYKNVEGGIMNFDTNSAFWITNLVTNWAYTRYNLMFPEIKKKILSFEDLYEKEVKVVDAKVESLQKQGKYEEAIEFVTNYSVDAGNTFIKEWNKLFAYLFARYLDGDVKTKISGEPLPKVEGSPYPQRWYDHIVETTGDHFLYVEGDERKSIKSCNKLTNKKIV